MKSRRVLYLLAGIINCIIGGLCALFGLFIVLFRNVIVTTFEKSTEILENFAKEMASIDSKYQYLLDANDAEIVDLIMGVVTAVCLMALIYGLVWIALGVFNIILSKKHSIIFSNKKWLKMLLVVGSWVLCLFNVANVLTTIAVFIKEKTVIEADGLYSADDN